MKRKTYCLLATLVLLVIVEANAFATTINYTFDQNNSGLTGGPWATIALTDTTYNGLDAVQVVVTPLASSFTSVGTNFGLQDFYFNQNTGDSNFANDVKVVFAQPLTWNSSYSAGSTNGGVGPYGKFELLNSGKGSNRANPLDFYLVASAASGLNLTASEFAVTSPNTDYIFAGHIADFTVTGANGVNSAQFASSGVPAPVPEPGTMMLLGVGFFGLAVYGKRRKNA